MIVRELPTGSSFLERGYVVSVAQVGAAVGRLVVELSLFPTHACTPCCQPVARRLQDTSLSNTLSNTLSTAYTLSKHCLYTKQAHAVPCVCAAGDGPRTPSEPR